MGFTQHDLTAKIRLMPEEARAELTNAFKDAKCSRTEAAKALGCTVQTFISWVTKAGLRAEFERIEKRAKKEGWHHGRNRMSPGRPKKKVKASRPRQRAAA